VLNGVRDVVHRITASISSAQIHTSSPIVGLEYRVATGFDGPTVDIHCVGSRTYSGFAHVVFATQANNGVPLLKTYLDSLTSCTEASSSQLEHHRAIVQDQIDCLSSFKYCKTIVVNHIDSTLLPSVQSDRRDLNLIVAAHPFPSEAELKASDDWSQSVCVHPSYTMATHVLPNLSGVYQTTNPIVPPAKEMALSVARLERAVVTRESKTALSGLWRASAEPGWRWGCAAQERGVLGPLQGAGALGTQNGGRRDSPGIWICGSFAHSGIPLLEGCVVSATNVVEQGILVCEGL
jgi:hypothetical protein